MDTLQLILSVILAIPLWRLYHKVFIVFYRDVFWGVLDKIVTAMDEIYDQADKLHDADVRGDIYEYLLSKIATAGVNGQFRTPRHIIRMMVDMMAPRADDVICDIKALRLIQFNYSSADFAA